MKNTWRERLRYSFDNFMARGTKALIGGLAIISLIAIIIIAAVVSLSQMPVNEGAPVSFFEAAWLSLMRTLDAGTMGGDSGIAFRGAMFAITLVGIFIISSLIGVLTSGVESKMEELRKGRSKVIEKNQTVILGWSPQVFAILHELIIANENAHQPRIVILGNKDKVEMEDEIHEKIGDSGNTRIICRSGSPVDMNDLNIASLPTSKSIIILAPETTDPDAITIKTILAITNNPERRTEPYHIVAEIRDAKNLEIARIVGKDEVELVLTGDLISRIIAQTCRQSGLSIVYTELLDFGGDEIYFKEEPALVGKSVGEALFAFEDSTVIGLKSAEGTRMHPPLETVIQPGDEIIAVSQDDDTIRLSGLQTIPIQESLIRTTNVHPNTAEHALILGWNWRAPAIINELDNYVAPGSSITIVADFADGQAEIERLCSAVQKQTIHYQIGDTTDRRILDALQAQDFNTVIVLSYDGLDEQEADARTLMTLLHLRDIAEKGGYRFSIVSEMLDIHNRELAEVTHADDFIVSDKIISLMLAQISENKSLNAILTDIFDPEGSEIYLKPVEDYVTCEKTVNFYTVLESARRRGQIAIGYRISALSSDASKSYGVTVNPGKSKEITFHPSDKIIIIADE